MCESSFTVGLFGCYQCNIKHNRKKLSMEKPKQSSSPPSVYRAQQGLAMLGLPSAPAGSDCGMEGSMSFLKATFLPQLLWAHLLLVKHPSESVLSTSQILSLPVASLLSLDMNCLTWKLPSCPPRHHFSRHWSQPLGLAPCWHKGAQPEHSLPREPPQSAPQAWLQICFSVSKIPLGTAEVLSSCCFLC